jgi:hypothetical protein
VILGILWSGSQTINIATPTWCGMKDDSRGLSSPRIRSRSEAMLFYGVVSLTTESVVEFFLEREQGERFVAEVESDEPDTAAELRIEVIELEG